MEDSFFTADGFTIEVSSQCMRGARIRYQQTVEFHFLTFGCYRRRPYPSTVAAMELLEDALERVRLRYLFAEVLESLTSCAATPHRGRCAPARRTVP